MIFEGTVSSVHGNQVKLALSNGQQILARLAGKFSFEQGQSVFFQVKNNDGGTIEIKPYTVDSIERIIEYGLANGYTFAPLTMESPVVHQKVNN